MQCVTQVRENSEGAVKRCDRYSSASARSTLLDGLSGIVEGACPMLKAEGAHKNKKFSLVV